MRMQGRACSAETVHTFPVDEIALKALVGPLEN